jgi:hypothetical protein
MEAIRSSETSVHTRFTRRNIPNGGILRSHRRENLKSYRTFFSTISSNIKIEKEMFNSSKRGHAAAQLVEALCYKQEGRGFHSR